MIKTDYGTTLTVGELIEELEKFPKDMPVFDSGFAEIEGVEDGHTIVDGNYPFTHPDLPIIMII